MTRSERFKILEEYNHRCAQCGDLGNEFNNTLELDHPCPLRAGGDNEQALIPLCSNCHSHKSYLECLTPFQENPLANVFEQSVYKAFHESPKPKQAVQQLHAPISQATVEIDTIRCRKSALEHNKHPLPIFSPLDQIQQLDTCTLGDYCFVDKDVEILDPATYARLLPYSGPRWYWRESVQYMLSTGVIRWSDIKYTLTTTAHLRHDFFANIFATIEETQANVRTQSLNNILP